MRKTSKLVDVVVFVLSIGSVGLGSGCTYKEVHEDHYHENPQPVVQDTQPQPQPTYDDSADRERREREERERRERREREERERRERENREKNKPNYEPSNRTTARQCPGCGNRILDPNVTQCPDCGTPLPR